MCLWALISFRHHRIVVLEHYKSSKTNTVLQHSKIFFMIVTYIHTEMQDLRDAGIVKEMKKNKAKIGK